MRRSSCQSISDAQVARLESRQKALGLTRATLLLRFEEALKRSGSVHTEAAAKMRLDRVLNRRMRRPMSEGTKSALAQALDWTIPQLERAIRVCSDDVRKKRAIQGRRPVGAILGIARDLNDVARRLQRVAQKLNKLARKKS